MESSEKDYEVRKAIAWSVCNKMKNIWKSKLNRKFKERLFITTVETVLLYGSETWTINKAMEKRIDGCYTRMLRKALNISWTQKLTNKELYKDLPKVSMKIRKRRMRLAGHCMRHEEEIASKLVLWEPKRGKRSRGRRVHNYIDLLMRDTTFDNAEEIRTAALDRDIWRELIAVGRAGARPK